MTLWNILLIVQIRTESRIIRIGSVTLRDQSRDNYT